MQPTIPLCRSYTDCLVTSPSDSSGRRTTVATRDSLKLMLLLQIQQCPVVAVVVRMLRTATVSFPKKLHLWQPGRINKKKFHKRREHGSPEKSTKALTVDLLLRHFLLALRPVFFSLGIQARSISEALAQESSGRVHFPLR